MQRRLKLLLALLITNFILSFVQITLGGIVRATGSGLGCPDWPTCHGSWVASFRDLTAFIEWSHRLSGFLLGISLVVTALFLLIYLRNKKHLILTISTGILTLIAGLIGALLVLSELEPVYRTIHLAAAMIVILLISISISLIVTQKENFIVTKITKWQVVILGFGAGIILFNLLWGSFMVWNDAHRLCPSWPFCGVGALVPENFGTWLNMLHRIFSVITILVAGYAMHIPFRLKPKNKVMCILAATVFILLIAQIFIGAANPWTGFAQWVTVAHLSLSTLTWALAAMVYAMAQSIYNSRKVTPESQSQLIIKSL